VNVIGVDGDRVTFGKVGYFKPSRLPARFVQEEVNIVIVAFGCLQYSPSGQIVVCRISMYVRVRSPERLPGASTIMGQPLGQIAPMGTGDAQPTPKMSAKTASKPR